MVKTINIFMRVVMGCGERWGFVFVPERFVQMHPGLVKVVPVFERERENKGVDVITWR